MPDRVYVGGHDAVEVVVNGECLVAVRNGDPVTVDAATAAEMDVSSAWAIPPASKSEKKE